MNRRMWVTSAVVAAAMCLPPLALAQDRGQGGARNDRGGAREGRAQARQERAQQPRQERAAQNAPRQERSQQAPRYEGSPRDNGSPSYRNEPRAVPRNQDRPSYDRGAGRSQSDRPGYSRPESSRPQYGRPENNRPEYRRPEYNTPNRPTYNNRGYDRRDNDRNYRAPSYNYGGRAVPRPRYEYRGYDPRGYSRTYWYSRPYYYSRPYARPYNWVPYRPYYFSRPWYSFRPRISIGFGIWIGDPVPYPWGYLGSYRPRVYGYYPDSYGYSVAPSTSIYGGLTFDIQPYDADVFVDEEYVGTVGTFSSTAEPLTLTPGVHRIAIQRDGYRSMEWEVTIEPGQVFPYRGEMERY